MARPNILYVVHRFPYPPDKGDRIRSYNVLKFLAARADVWLASFADERVGPAHRRHVERLVHRTETVKISPAKQFFSAGSSFILGRSISESVFNSRRMTELIRGWARETNFNAVVVSASSLGRYVDLPELAGASRLVDYVDVDSEKWRQYAEESAGPRKFIYQREYQRVLKLELDLLHKTDAATLVSDQEAELLRSICRGRGVEQMAIDRIHAVTNGVDLDYFSPQPAEPDSSICFLGAMDYRPNVDAVNWFACEVWPHLRKAYPQLVFNIVGRKPAPEVTALERHPGINVTGPVDDVRTWLAKASVVVAPLRIARGVQNKVLEAMAMARPVVASPEALTGLKAVPDTDVLQATTPDDWFYQIRRVLQSNDLRSGLESAARRYVEEHHSWDAALSPLAEMLALTDQEAPAVS